MAPGYGYINSPGIIIAYDFSTRVSVHGMRSFNCFHTNKTLVFDCYQSFPCASYIYRGVFVQKWVTIWVLIMLIYGAPVRRQALAQFKSIMICLVSWA